MAYFKHPSKAVISLKFVHSPKNKGYSQKKAAKPCFLEASLQCKTIRNYPNPEKITKNILKNLIIQNL
jgi:hypothetical protein